MTYTPASSLSQKRASILLVDESEESRQNIVQLLMPYHDIHAVVGTDAAWGFLLKQRPDLILCDEFNSPEMLKMVRDNKDLQHMVVLVQMKADAFQQGRMPVDLSVMADDYLPAPCPTHLLLSRIHAHWKQIVRRKGVEENHRQNEAILQSLIVSASDCLSMLNLEGRFLWMSEGGQHFMGITDFSTWKQRSWPSIWLEPQTQLQAGAALDNAAKKQTGHFRGLCATADGRPRWWDVTLTPILDDQGSPSNILCVMRDVTEIQRSEQSLRSSETRWRELMHAVPHLIWSCTSDGLFDFVNAQWQVYTGIPGEQHLGDHWQSLVHPEDVEDLRQRWRGVSQTGYEFHAEIRLQARAGDYQWFKVTALSARDASGNVIKWYGSNTNIEELKRAESALRENEARLTAIFEQAGAGIVQTDREGHYLMVNDAYCEITGRSREELLNLKTSDTTHPEDVEPSRPPYEALFEGGPPFIIEQRYLHPDGAVVWARRSLVSLKDAEGHPVAALAIVQDITESRLAEEELLEREAQLSLVTNHAPVLLAQLDTQLRYKFVNKPYANRYGHEPNEMVGLPLVSIIGTEAMRRAFPHIQQALAGERVEFELELPYKNPKLGTRWGHVIYVPEFNLENEVVGFLAVLTDITIRKQVERELEQARDEALAASRAKDEFLARLSHELRTPLNPALLLASEAANNSQLPASIRADFETIRKNVDLEARLIDDLLDITRITRGKLVLDTQPLHIQDILEDAIKTVLSEAKQKNLALDLKLQTPDIVINGDAVRLQQVIWNVLKNAIKFSPAGERIQISTHLNRDIHVIEISDHGIGMAPDEMDKIFHAFAQGHHADDPAMHRFGGLGLGLTISRMLMELHSGRIHATSHGRGQGATFYIELPMTGRQQRSVNKKTEPVFTRSSPAQLRILLVEDHEPTREAMASLLKRRQHHVIAVSTVNDALSASQAYIFDLLISDIGLPDGNGYDLMQTLHHQCGIPGIALTGYGMEHDIARSKEVGFCTHLTKPVRVQVLEEAIVASLRSNPVQV